jgi:putative transposase
VAEVLPLLYLHGLSSSDFGPAPEQFLGSTAGHYHAADRAVAERRRGVHQALVEGHDYVYVWVDGIVRHVALCGRARVEDPRRPVVVATG